MSKIIFDSGISLDGFFAGDNRSPSNAMGDKEGESIGKKIYTKQMSMC